MGIAGIGFVFTDQDPYCGIDIDDCRNPDTGELTSFAQGIADKIDSYCEASRSGTGLHIIAKAKPSFRGNKNSADKIEIYFSRRYFTMTGNVLDNRGHINDRQAEVDAIIGPYFNRNSDGRHQLVSAPSETPKTSGLPYDDIIQKIKNGSYGDKIQELFNGGWEKAGYQSQSEADLALCNFIRDRVGTDSERIDPFFRKSGLMRPKWDEKRGTHTYGQMTIEKALKSSIPVVAGDNVENHRGVDPQFYNAADLLEMDIPELIFAVHEILPQGLAILAGKPKQGKSILALQTAIAVATGTPVMDKFEVEKGTVIYFALEDGERRMQDRLKMMLPEGATGLESLVISHKIKTISEDGIKWLDSIIGEYPGLRLVIIDTFVLFRPEKQKSGARLYDLDYKEVAAVKAIADKHSVTILLIHHQRKEASDDVIDSFSGTHGITGAADTLLALEKDSKNEECSRLSVRGRDVEEAEYTVVFDKTKISWSVMGAGSIIRSTSQQQKLMDTLREKSSRDKPLSPKELEEMTELAPGYIRNNLTKFVKASLIMKADRGKYYYNEDV